MDVSSKNRSVLRLSTSILIVAGISPLTALSADMGVFEEIMVTAQRREQSLQDVPVSVSALTQESIKAKGVTRLQEYFSSIPGLSYQQIGAGERNGQSVAVRGVGNTRLFAVSDGTAAQTVGFYINDVPIQAVDNKLFDVSRIEVLKGPQGTLYGQASLGGTIKIETNKPVFNEFEALVEATGSYTEGGEENFDINVMVNAPLVKDKLSARFVAYHRDEGGYIDWRPADPANPFARALDLDGTTPQEDQLLSSVDKTNVRKNANDETTTGGRLALRFVPTENLEISPFVWFQDRRSTFDNAYDRDLGGELVQRRFFESPRKESFFLAGLPIEYDFGAASFTSVTSYYNRKSAWDQDLSVLAFNLFGGDGSGGLAVPTIPSVSNESESISQEFRLASTDNSGPEWLDWLIGGSYYQEKRNSPIFWAAPGFNANAGPGAGIPRADELIQAAKQDFDFETFGVFGDVTAHLTEALSVSAGLRWYDIDQSFVRFDNGALAGCDASNGFCLASDVEQAESGIIPRVNVSYKVTEDNMVYASAAQGFRAGGFNNVSQLSTPSCAAAVAAANIDPSNPGFDSDKVWQYEVGSKNSFSSGRVNLNAAAFWIDWTDLQQSVALVAFDPACAFAATSNVGSATIKGFEIETNFRPVDSLAIGGTLSYTRARVGAPPPGAVDREGQPIQGVPDWTASAYAQYDFSVMDEYNSYIRVDWQYVDGRKGPGFVPDNPFFDVKSYNLTNIRFGIMKNNIETILFLENAFDTIPEFGALPLAGEAFTNQVLIGRPRTVGLTVRVGL